jgi:hypothetical protein
VPSAPCAAASRLTSWNGHDERKTAVTVAMFSALEALAAEEVHHEHECGEHDDVCDDECCIACAVIPGEGLE